MKMITYILWVIFLLLAFTAGYLIWFNRSDETFSKIVPSIFIGLIGVIATIFFSAKEYKMQKTFNAVFFINPQNNEILHPENFDLPRFYDQTFCPNESGNNKALSKYPPMNKLKGDEIFKFYNYINASLLYQFFIQLRELNQKFKDPDFSKISYNENLELDGLKMAYYPLRDYVDIDTCTFRGNFHYLPDWNGEPMPKDLQVKFISTPIGASVTGCQEMIIYRKNFFEFEIKAEVINSVQNNLKGFIEVQFTNTVKFDKLTSQHRLNKVYQGYCRELTSLLEGRYEDKKNIKDYKRDDSDWFKL